MTLLLLLLTQTAFAANTKFISVTGRCTRDVSPDRARVVLMSDVVEASPSAAASKAIKIYEKVRADVKKLGLKNLQLQTSNYNVNPEYNYDGGKQKLKGYRAQMGIEVETSEIPRLGEVIELGVKAGVQNVSQLTTFLSPAVMQEQQESCLEEAVKNARLKAEKMAKAGGAKVGEIISIEEFKSGQGRPPEPAFMAKGRMEMMADSPPPPPSIESKTDSISVTVFVGFSLQ